MGTIIWIVIACSMFFIYYDTTKNKIGKIPDEKWFLNLSPGLWTIATWLLWIVAFPLYLINRSKLIEKAKQKPQNVPEKRRKIVLGILGVVVVVVVFTGIFSMSAGKSNIEKSAIPVVNQIIHEQLSADPTVECVQVKLGEEFADNNYHATATLNNGNALKITIQIKGEQFYVQIPNQ